MDGARLWIVDPSVSNPEDQGVEEILDGWRGPSRVFRPCLRPGDGPGPRTGHETDGVVVMGSAASVHEPTPWMDDLAAWVRPLLSGRRPLPLLGICFGHQLLAHLAGGRVELARADGSKSVGVEVSRLEGGRLLPGSHALHVVVSHREVVREAPPAYRVVAGRPGVPIDGLEHVDLPIFSFQFHPEARDDFARTAGFDPQAVDRRVREDGQRVLGAFRERVRSYAAAPKKEPAVDPPAP